MNEHNHNLPRACLREPLPRLLWRRGPGRGGRFLTRALHFLAFFRHALRPLVSPVLPWLCYFAVGILELNLNAQTFPPPVGSGIVATLQADQDVYTNHPAE